ncbi:MAG: tetratricopeptide repeat protein [Proteobacteria bacterium]|jgi:tetratricopeptide (TPR) repeat protein|nr:tetratricopeptide repeat protein [Pseudomonadota bacterium]
MRSLFAVLTVLLMTLGGLSAGATQADPRLDSLFDQLKKTTNAREADGIERQIWSIWMEAGAEDLNILMRQGTVAMAERDFPLAMESFDALIALAPDMAEAWNKRATLHYLMQNFEASVADVQQTLALEPRHFGAIVGMGMIYDQLGDQAAALKAFEQGLKINPHMETILEKSKKIAQELRDRNI